MKEEKEETPTTIPVSELVSNKKVSISLGLTLIVLASTMIVGISIWEIKPTVSTSYYHFNIQYRAGDEVSYEEIIENTFQHMVWMYGNHSNWHYTIECQFMLIEYLYEHDGGKYRHIFDAVQKQNE